MRVQIKRPVSVAVNGKLKDFSPGSEVTLPQDAAMRLVRTLSAIRLPDQVSPQKPKHKRKPAAQRIKS